VQLGGATWPEVAAADRACVLAVPVGSLEQHGPHLPWTRIPESRWSWRRGSPDALLEDPAVLATLSAHWRHLEAQGGQDLLGRGRPTIAMDTYLRMMVAKHRGGYGYETLVAAVSDSIHLRRFCRIPLRARVSDE
jgi:hypothetical protein